MKTLLGIDAGERFDAPTISVTVMPIQVDTVGPYLTEGLKPVG